MKEGKPNVPHSIYQSVWVCIIYILSVFIKAGKYFCKKVNVLRELFNFLQRKIYEITCDLIWCWRSSFSLFIAMNELDNHHPCRVSVSCRLCSSSSSVFMSVYLRRRCILSFCSPPHAHYHAYLFLIHLLDFLSLVTILYIALVFLIHSILSVCPWTLA